MKKETITRYIIPIVISLFTILFGLEVGRLGLLLDDNVHIFPAIAHLYIQHFTGYTYNYGLFRPLALMLFYGIYTVYLWSGPFAHLLIFAFHVGAALLLYDLAKKYLGQTKGLLISLLFLSWPLFIEQYGWFAASNATLSNFILMVQVWLIFKSTMTSWKKLACIFVLQVFGVFLYESMLFTFLPIVGALSYISGKRIRSIQTFLFSILLFVPSLWYVFLRDVVFPPHVAATIRELQLHNLADGSFISIIGHNFLLLPQSFGILFSSYALQFFWLSTLAHACLLLVTQWWVLLFGIGAFISLIYYVVMTRQNVGISVHKDGILFCLILGIFSILPTFLLLQAAFPFRVIAPALFLVVLSLYLFLDKHFPKATIWVFIVTILFCSFMVLGMLGDMKEQATEDQQLFTQLMVRIDKEYKAGEKTTLIIDGMTHSTVTQFIYGEYLSSCINTPWCLQVGLNMRTDKIYQVLIDPPKAAYAKQPYILFHYDPDTTTLRFVKKTLQ